MACLLMARRAPDRRGLQPRSLPRPQGKLAAQRVEARGGDLLTAQEPRKDLTIPDREIVRALFDARDQPRTLDWPSCLRKQARNPWMEKRP